MEVVKRNVYKRSLFKLFPDSDIDKLFAVKIFMFDGGLSEEYSVRFSL